MRSSGDPKYAHLEQDLHVLIEVEAPPGQAHARLGLAIEEIKKFLVPVSTVSFVLPLVYFLLTSASRRRDHSPSTNACVYMYLSILGKTGQPLHFNFNLL